MLMKKQAWTKRPLIRILIIWIVEALSLVLLTFVMRSLSVDSLLTAFLAAAAIGLLNALLWPLLSYLILPFAVLTLGLASLALNGFIIWLAGQIVPGFMVASLWSAVLAALAMTASNIIASSLLTIDDDNSYYRNVVRRRARRWAKPAETETPGFLFLEIDGLAEPVLEKAMANGYAPTMKRWLATGSHKLTTWETDLSSQTSAGQAGILHGNNNNIPAFRWYNRQQKKIISSNSPDEMAALEKRLSDGNGLLNMQGVSRGNLLSGDAPYVMTTASTMKDLSRLHLTDFYTYFVNPYNFTRTLLLVVWDLLLEKWQFHCARKNKVHPILDKQKRGGKYPLLRVFTTVIMRELNIYTLIGDMYAGVNSAYATFVGYDEVAHHSGVESTDAFDILHKLDEQFARLESAAASAPRPYHFVVLSDHGQSSGATFKQRYGYTLEGLVQQLARESLVQAVMSSDEAWGHINVFLNDAMQHDEKSSDSIRRLLKKNQRADGEVVLGPEELAETAVHETANILVLASGNLGLVYSTNRDKRVTLEEVEEVFPDMLAGLTAHEGVGFVMIHSGNAWPGGYQ
ncbi:MAG: phage holin family protein [Chloroflexi bacterium]|nr:phage holin family protein [Chloroflexota bacterium]